MSHPSSGRANRIYVRIQISILSHDDASRRGGAILFSAVQLSLCQLHQEFDNCVPTELKLKMYTCVRPRMREGRQRMRRRRRRALSGEEGDGCERKLAEQHSKVGRAVG